MFTWAFHFGQSVSSRIQNAQRLCGGSPPPAPQSTICLFLRCAEIRHRSLGAQAVLSISWRPCVSFVLSPDIGITSSGFFFSFSASAFNFLFPLTSVFSAFFHSFLFSVRIPPPLLCFWFLVTRFPDSFLFRNPCLGPASFQSFWSFFLTAWSLTFIPFPTLRYHLLEPLKSSGGVSPGPAALCRGNKSTGWCFQCDDCESDRLSPVLFWTSAHGPGSRLWLIVTILFQLFSICRPYCG